MKILLHGKIGKLFGKEWDLKVKTLKEAMHAINVNTKRQLEKYLRTDGQFDEFVVKINDNFLLNLDETKIPLGAKAEVNIYPKIDFAGRYILGIVQIIVGVILIIANWGTTSPLGISLVIGGIASIIITAVTPIPIRGPQGATQISNLFDGTSQLIQQGSAVPVGYGRIGVNPAAISLSVSNDNIRVAYGRGDGYQGGGGIHNHKPVYEI